ncbi:subunit of CoA-transferase of family III [Anopheles sinensis]|uniref:Subunit of CoA-transferase of family III n=1 Tax=Anopheles sinensis TaxID=74873 RepID=A0A084VUZ1_ANOSI|nr:subunit of CoA-transferase of family III [Anopheles sinensis]
MVDLKGSPMITPFGLGRKPAARSDTSFTLPSARRPLPLLLSFAGVTFSVRSLPTAPTFRASVHHNASVRADCSLRLAPFLVGVRACVSFSTELKESALSL